MTSPVFRRFFVPVVMALALALAAPSIPQAAIYVGSLNCLRLGHNHPAGADQANKKIQIRNRCAMNNVTLLQEVMVTSEVANVRPNGYSSQVSALKGPSTYKEAYGFVYNVSTTGSMIDYTGSGFDRPPSGLRFWTGAKWVWLVNYHAAFDATPNANEIQNLHHVYNHYKGRNSVNSVIIGGDFNRVATSSYFNNLKNTGCSSIQPDVATTINSSCAWASRYDHFAWDSSLTTVTNANRGSLSDVCYWRNNVSDHAPIFCYVY
ncbi:MAG: hypothetical protein KF858_00780 [Candidatus Sumerlaeia bacterium]|nr:hypothetical protein [Candidatus Sumerlaeia bacterium]